VSEQEWSFSYEGPLHEVFPALHEAQSAYLAQIDSLQALDRKTHELVRTAVSVAARNAGAVQRHAQLAAEVGASWEEVLASILLTQPAVGIGPAVEAIPVARSGFEAGVAIVADESEDESEGDE
jgi:alkylhydroperoxidase/carboxymuconolactone decarboxylase family protein YurZ